MFSECSSLITPRILTHHPSFIIHQPSLITHLSFITDHCSPINLVKQEDNVKYVNASWLSLWRFYLQDGGIADLSSKRRVDDIDGGLSLEMKIEEYLRRKKAKKQGLFNDEIDFGSDYYEDFDIEDAEDRDNLNSYDYTDFIANNNRGNQHLVL